MHSIKMLVLDMAGTTVNEDNVVYKTLWKTIANAGFEIGLNTVLEHGAGKEKLQAIKDILSHLEVENRENEGTAESIHANFLIELDHAYREIEVSSYPGLLELFKELRTNDVRVVLNTGYNREIASLLIKRLGWEEGRDFDLLVTASDVEKSRPAPDMIELAMRKLSLTEAMEVAKIGDSIIDIEEGKAAGCGFVAGVTTGAHTKEQLQSANPDYIFDQLSDVKEVITFSSSPV